MNTFKPTNLHFFGKLALFFLIDTEKKGVDTVNPFFSDQFVVYSYQFTPRR